MKSLVCIDNDLRYEETLASLSWCLGLGKQDEVLVSHVVVPLRWMPKRTDDDPGWAGTERAILEKVQDFLQQAADGLDHVRARPLLLEGDAAAEILSAADQHGVDCIVLGAVGQARSQDFLVGSVAENVASTARHSVLLVRGTPAAPDGSYRALLAVDGSPGSLAAVETFAARPSARAAEIHLVHAIDLPPATWDLDVEGAGRLAEVTPTAIQERADRAIDEARDILEAKGLTADVKLRRGPAAAEILESARNLDAELIVLGSPGTGTEGPLSLGSVSRRVARHAPCSVLLAYPGSGV